MARDGRLQRLRPLRRHRLPRAVDHLDEIRFDDDVAWNGPVSRSTADSTAITVPDRDTITIYWGTATQPLRDNGVPGQWGQVRTINKWCLLDERYWSDWLVCSRTRMISDRGIRK
jgi:hypothetical protein